MALQVTLESRGVNGRSVDHRSDSHSLDDASLEDAGFGSTGNSCSEPMAKRRWANPNSRENWSVFIPTLCSEEMWKDKFGMSRGIFNRVVEELRPHLPRQEDPHLRGAVPVEKQVAMTIYYLANGDSFSTVATYFGVEKSTACKAILQVVTAMEMGLLGKAVYLGDYRKVMAGFEALGFPQVIGAVDGCRVRIVPPVEPGAEFTYRKPHISMALLGTCDHTGRFTDVLLGWPAESNHYSFILRTSAPYNAMRAGVFLSERPSLRVAGKQVGPLLLADVNYPLKPWVMTPFKGSSLCPEQAVYNQRHNQARNVVKAAFARLKARWRCLTSSLEVSQTDSNSFLAACVILHNIVESDGEVLTSGPPGPQCFTVNPANFLPEDVETQEGKDIRQAFVAFFCAQNQ